MSRWRIVTNGQSFRLQDTSGLFHTEIRVLPPFGNVIPEAKEFLTYKEAKAERDRLEEKERLCTWTIVPDGN